MELQPEQQTVHDLDANKPTLSADDQLAQQQFAQSIPVIEREHKAPRNSTRQSR